MAVDHERQRSEFGGFHFGTAFFGWLVATGVGVLLLALVTAIGGAVASQTGGAFSNHIQTVGVSGAIALLIALAISYYAGGYVAGRLSRFDGARQGFGVWVIGIIITLILAVVGAILGSNYNLVQQVGLSSFSLNHHTATMGSIIWLITTLVVTAVMATIGGKVGERFHAKVDRLGEVPEDRPVRTEERARNERYRPAFHERVEPRDRSRDDQP